MPLEEGKKIWVESLMTHEEWTEWKRNFPSMSVLKSHQPPMFECDFKWRWGMGAPVSLEQRTIINKRIDELKKLIKKEE